MGFTALNPSCGAASAANGQFRTISFCEQFRVISFHSACRAASQNGTFLTWKLPEDSTQSPMRQAAGGSWAMVPVGSGERDRVFVQCHFGPSGPIRYG
jgi:hypothetical protein